ncbi:MAG: FAD-dependent monooxygenase [Gammaproteobacteria bacterium]
MRIATCCSTISAMAEVFFIGDAAHVVCPFGARGGNNGIQDAANLAWKLALVLAGKAPPRLLDSYSAERRAAAVENLRVTSRTTRFLAPRSPAERILRNAVLDLARRHEFARPLVNTGRMCVANDYPPSPCLPQGGVSVQNAPLCLPDGRPGGLMDLLADGTALIGVWFAPTDASVGEVAGLLRKPCRSPSMPVATRLACPVSRMSKASSPRIYGWRRGRFS